MTTHMWDPSMPPVYQDLVMRWGGPVGVEEARNRWGELVSAAADFLHPVPQVLARYRRPVAALIAAVVLDGRPDAGERLNVETLLTGGGTVTLAYEPGISGATNEAGDVTQEPWPPCFTAT